MSASWSVAVTTEPLHPVVVEDGRVFACPAGVAGAKKSLHALSVSDGSTLWVHDFGNSTLGQPAVVAGRVYVATFSQLHAFDAATGTPLWVGDSGGLHSAAPIVVGNQVYVGGPNALYSFDAVTGAPGFNAPLPGSSGWSPALKDGGVYTFVAGSFRAHDPSTGATLWSVDVFANGAGTPHMSASSSLAYQYVGGEIAAINTATKSIVSAGTASPITGMAVSPGSWFRTQGGKLVWTSGEFEGDGTLKYPAVIVSPHVFVASDTNVYAVHILSAKQIWTANVGGWLAVAAHRLLVARADGTLHAYLFDG
jgi:hypothetical protein